MDLNGTHAISKGEFKGDDCGIRELTRRQRQTSDSAHLIHLASLTQPRGSGAFNALAIAWLSSPYLEHLDLRLPVRLVPKVDDIVIL